MKYIYAIIGWLMFAGWISIYLFLDWRAGRDFEAVVYWFVAFMLANNLVVITWGEKKQ